MTGSLAPRRDPGALDPAGHEALPALTAAPAGGERPAGGENVRRRYALQTAEAVRARLPYAALVFLAVYAGVALFELRLHPQRTWTYVSTYMVDMAACAVGLALTRRWAEQPARSLLVTVALAVTLIWATTTYHIIERGEAEVLALALVYLTIGFLVAFPWGGWPQLVAASAAAVGLACGLASGVRPSTDTGILVTGTLALAGLSVAAAALMDRHRFGLFLAQEDLRESEARFRAVVQHSSDLIFLAGADGVIAYVSPSIEPILGYAPEDVVGRRVLEFVHLRDRAAVTSATAAVLREASARVTVEYRARHRDGRWVDLEATGTNLLHDPAIRGIVGMARDITERKRVERELVAAKEAAEAASGARRDFVANVSHDLRTPTNIIFGMADMVLDTAVTAEQRELVETIRHAAGQLHSLLNDLLDLSKMDAGKIDLQLRPFALRAWLQSALAPHIGEAWAKGLAFTSEVDAAVPDPVVGDPDRLRQVLGNLVGNAVKFTDRGSVALRVTPAPGAADRLRFTVSDSGAGIAPDELPRLFQPFSQTSTTSNTHGGTGLGLAICKRLVELMHGEIGVSSDLGRGSAFWFQVGLAAEPH